MKLKVPELFAVKEGRKEGGEVQHKFNKLLQDYIHKHKDDISKKINVILVSDNAIVVFFSSVSR